MDKYDTLRKKLENALCDLAILAGDVVDTHSVGWQNVAGTASVNLRSLANALDSLRQGETHHQGCPWSGPTVFPSPMEICEKVYGPFPSEADALADAREGMDDREEFIPSQYPDGYETE